MKYEAKEFTVKDGLKVTLKTPDKTEAEKLLNFIIDIAAQTEYLLSSPEDKKFNIEDEERWIEANINSEDVFIVVYDGDRIVGDCSVNYHTHIKDKHRGTIGIGIDKDYWNKGIGSLLFDEMIRLSKEKGCIEQLELGVSSRNARAKHLYEKKGFTYTGRIPNALKLKDGTYADEELMIRFI